MKTFFFNNSRPILLVLLLAMGHIDSLSGQNVLFSEIRYLIDHVNVVDVKKEEVRPDQSILDSKGIIESVRNSYGVDVNDFKTVIGAQGKYPFPGLRDLHSPKRGNRMPSFINRECMIPFFIANEVTGVRDIVLGGRIPLRRSEADASRKGLRSLEHARDLLFEGFFNAEDFRQLAMSQDPSAEWMQAIVGLYDPDRTADISEIMVKNDTWYVPTHVKCKMETFDDAPSFIEDARNQYSLTMLLDAWNADADRVVALDSTAYGREAYRKFYRMGLEITMEAFDAGIRILVGTDVGDSYVYPGFAVHDELEELVFAGSTPMEAFRAATIDTAEFLGMEGQFGTIVARREADFLLSDAIPVRDIGHTKDIHVLICRGGST